VSIVRSNLAALADDLGKVWHGPGSADVQSGAGIVPERDTGLVACLDRRQECVAAIATDIAAGATTDLASGDLAPNVVFGTVGVERYPRAAGHHRQSGLVGMQSRQQPVESDKAGAAPEYPLEAGPQDDPAFRVAIPAIRLEGVMAAPDQLTLLPPGEAGPQDDPAFRVAIPAIRLEGVMAAPDQLALLLPGEAVRRGAGA